jgi:hypothetical protein
MLSPSTSSAVATLVAIWQKASCGVRTLMACQLRFNTSTVALVSISFIKIHAAASRKSVANLLFTPQSCQPRSTERSHDTEVFVLY